MTSRLVHIVVPGPLDQRTGGYLYDAHMVEGLRRLGRYVEVHALEGAFPSGEGGGEEALAAALRGLRDGAVVVVDGLAGGGLPAPLQEHGPRLHLLAIVHHPLADETGLDPATRERLLDSETRALAACEGVIVTSDTTARRVEELGVPAGRIRTVRPGTHAAAAARGPASGEPARLLSVGTITPRKGHDVLIQALARVSDLEWTCVCVGSTERDPIHAASVSKSCSALGLSDRVTFTGECDEQRLMELYETSSLFVSASHYEGYGMAFAEALARGLPVVGTTGGAIAATVPSGAGVLVPPGDPVALADALRGLLEDASQRARMSAAAAKHARALPTWEQAAQEFATAIRELVPEPARAAHGLEP